MVERRFEALERREEEFYRREKELKELERTGGKGAKGHRK
jgi:ribonuclease Y